MKFFLNSFYYGLFVLCLFVSWMIGSWLLFLAVSLAILIILYFSRKASPNFQSDAALKEGIIYSPVNGKVVGLTNEVNHYRFGEKLTEIVIMTPWWKEAGLYLPIESEVKNLFYDGGKGFFRFFKKTDLFRQEKPKPSLSLGMTCRNTTEYGIDFYKCPLGLWPKVRVIPGDRGKAQVNIGFFGLGGTTVLYLPPSYEILVNEGIELTAGETILARHKDSE